MAMASSAPSIAALEYAARCRCALHKFSSYATTNFVEGVTTSAERAKTTLSGWVVSAVLMLRARSELVQEKLKVMLERTEEGLDRILPPVNENESLARQAKVLSFKNRITLLMNVLGNRLKIHGGLYLIVARARLAQTMEDLKRKDRLRNPETYIAGAQIYIREKVSMTMAELMKHQRNVHELSKKVLSYIVSLCASYMETAAAATKPIRMKLASIYAWLVLKYLSIHALLPTAELERFAIGWSGRGMELFHTVTQQSLGALSTVRSSSWTPQSLLTTIKSFVTAASASEKDSQSSAMDALSTSSTESGCTDATPAAS